MKKISHNTAERYTWGGVCDGWHLLRSGELSIIEERMPPGSLEARHRHARSRQMFYVLAGELTMEVEGDTQVLSPGEALEISPGEAHQARNTSGADVRFLVVSQPRSHGDRESA